MHLHFFTHLDVCHPARGAVQIPQHLPALDVDQMAAFHGDVAVGGEVEVLHADGAAGGGVVGDAFVLGGDGDAVAAGEAVLDGLGGAPAAHLAVLLGGGMGTQWKMSLALCGLLSYSLHFRQAYSPNTVSHWVHCSPGYCSFIQFKHFTFSTPPKSIRSSWHPFLYSYFSSWHSLQG